MATSEPHRGERSWVYEQVLWNYIQDRRAGVRLTGGPDSLVAEQALMDMTGKTREDFQENRHEDLEMFLPYPASSQKAGASYVYHPPNAGTTASSGGKWRQMLEFGPSTVRSSTGRKVEQSSPVPRWPGEGEPPVCFVMHKPYMHKHSSRIALETLFVSRDYTVLLVCRVCERYYIAYPRVQRDLRYWKVYRAGRSGPPDNWDSIKKEKEEENVKICDNCYGSKDVKEVTISIEHEDEEVVSELCSKCLGALETQDYYELVSRKNYRNTNPVGHKN